jgi:nitrite reductase/ring-hydroxylating ferredoxin subunit/uncharacterized membrane protein
MQTNLARIGDTAVTAIEQQPWLDRLADRLAAAVGAAFDAAGPAGHRLRDVLHGTWLGHPLHPVLTDVPLGAWTAALVLDGLDGADRGRWRRRSPYAAGADAAIGVGVAGAVAAAVTGLADWQHTSGGARRTGLVHAMLNTTALACYAGSLVLRRRGDRSAGRGLATAGYAIATASAWLGGTLVYRERVGVNRAPHPDGPTAFVAVLPETALGEGELRRVQVEGVPVVLTRRDGRIGALVETCSHMGGPLAEGRLQGDAVECPWHGSRFALQDGRVIAGPATVPQPCYETRVRNGQIEVRRPGKME